MADSLIVDASKSASRGYARVYAICNERSGGVCAEDRERLRDLLAAEGFAQIKFLEAERVDAIARAGKRDLVVVLGGDGTARAAAAAASRSNGPTLVLLPGGTMNLLPKLLYGELDWASALSAALRDGKPRPLCGGAANGKPFFVAAAFGGVTLVARAREATRRGRLLTALKWVGRIPSKALDRWPLKVRIERGAKTIVRSVGVLLAEGRAGDRLEFARFAGESVMDYVRLGMRGVVGAWRDDPQVECVTGREMTIEAHGMIPAILDGEPMGFAGRIKVAPLKVCPRVLALDKPE